MFQILWGVGAKLIVHVQGPLTKLAHVKCQTFWNVEAPPVSCSPFWLLFWQTFDVYHNVAILKCLTTLKTYAIRWKIKLLFSSQICGLLKKIEGSNNWWWIMIREMLLSFEIATCGIQTNVRNTYPNPSLNLKPTLYYHCNVHFRVSNAQEGYTMLV